MTSFPALFVSHGAPNLILHNSAAREFLAGYGQSLGKPKAIVMVSAHFETDRPTVVADPAPGMIYDFGGFEPELRDIVYPAPGAPDLARRVSELLKAEGLEVETIEERGYDHGAWVPLKLLYPDADCPVVQLSVQPEAGPAHHAAVGRALASLRDDGVLTVGSGAFTHNLPAIFANFRNGSADAETVPWVKEFADWATARIVAGDTDALADYRSRAPHAAENHPTEEHFLPLFVAMGAGGGGAGRHVHSSSQYGAMMMDAFAFG